MICRTSVGQNVLALGVIVYLVVVMAAYLYSEVFSSRAALLHVGAMVATWMTGNVFFIIIPNQKKVVASLRAGEQPDPRLGLQAKQRSTHNNYLTLPVLFMMLSNHYPMTFVGEDMWFLVALIVLIGAVVRDYFNAGHAGGTGMRVRWQWPVATVLVVFLAFWTRPEPIAVANLSAVTDTRVQSIVTTHCAGCHAAVPTTAGFNVAPKGIVLETLKDVEMYRAQVYAQAVATQAMPIGNMTGMTHEERMILGSWLESR